MCLMSAFRPFDDAVYTGYEHPLAWSDLMYHTAVGKLKTTRNRLVADSRVIKA